MKSKTHNGIKRLAIMEAARKNHEHSVRVKIEDLEGKNKFKLNILNKIKKLLGKGAS